MLNSYFVMHSTVTKLKLSRLSSITIKKQQLLLINQTLSIMRTLNNNQITSKSPNSNSYNWNSKRRFR